MRLAVAAFALSDFIAGAISMGALAAAMWFLRAYRSTRDRLFALFSLAFLLLAADRLALIVLSTEGEFGFAVYLLRLLSFVLILMAIADKNLVRRRRE